MPAQSEPRTPLKSYSSRSFEARPDFPGSDRPYRFYEPANDAPITEAAFPEAAVDYVFGGLEALKLAGEWTDTLIQSEATIAFLQEEGERQSGQEAAA